MIPPAKTRMVAASIGAAVAVSPLVIFCLAAIGGLFSVDARDDAPQRGAAIFLTAGVPIVFGGYLGATSFASMLFKQKLLRSIPLLILTSLLAPLGIVLITVYFYAYDPRSVIEKDRVALLLSSTVVSVCLCAGLFSSRWYLKKAAEPGATDNPGDAQ